MDLPASTLMSHSQDLERSWHGLILTYPEYYNLASGVPLPSQPVSTETQTLAA